MFLDKLLHKKAWQIKRLIRLFAPQVGLEPTTSRLTADCSTDWATEERSYLNNYTHICLNVNHFIKCLSINASLQAQAAVPQPAEEWFCLKKDPAAVHGAYSVPAEAAALSSVSLSDTEPRTKLSLRTKNSKFIFLSGHFIICVPSECRHRLFWFHKVRPRNWHAFYCLFPMHRHHI